MKSIVIFLGGEKKKDKGLDRVYVRRVTAGKVGVPHLGFSRMIT
jgi:hypothetical protein